MKSFGISLFIIIAIVLLMGFGFIHSGAFNVAATSKDPALLSWVLETTREHSIENHSSDITAPDKAELAKTETLREGFEHYNEMCVVCHGAPGIDPGEAREGLNPKPPLLAKLKDLETDPLSETFWIIKHGIKMTGMPGWGPTHSDDKIWAMVAFVRKLPSMSAAEYQALRQQLKESGDDEEHEHEHIH
jgi:mono/diheme cytochrome c family protein